VLRLWGYWTILIMGYLREPQLRELRAIYDPSSHLELAVRLFQDLAYTGECFTVYVAKRLEPVNCLVRASDDGKKARSEI